MARIIVLTGGIASGKSTVAEYLRQEKGAAVINADHITRALQQPGCDGYQAICQAFGKEYVLHDGQLNRPKLAGLIFQDAGAKEKLESILHPLIYQAINTQIQKSVLAGHGLVVAEIPLLFETSMQHQYPEVWLVAASKTVQLQRLMQWDGLNKQQALARIHAQMPLSQKTALADAVIHTDQGKTATYAQVDALLSRPAH